MAWRHEAPNQAAEKALVSLVNLVCRVCLLEPNKPDRPDEPDKPQMNDAIFLSILMNMVWVGNTFASESVANPGG